MIKIINKENESRFLIDLIFYQTLVFSFHSVNVDFII